jgi:CMP-N,N'-diacetyllegionaminic acid synthase
MNILCIIPVRSGSKGIPDKNIKILNGKPLLVWSIEQAQHSKYFKQMKIVVSTDSVKYQKISIKNGAEAPFLRPDNISQDLSTDYECINHCVNWLNNNEKYYPNIILQLRATQPSRKVKDIDECLDIFINNFEKYDSLRSVVEFKKSPYKMYTIDDVNNKLKPLFQEIQIKNKNIIEPFNQCRQLLPKSYLHNGYIDVFKTSILKNGCISGDNIYPYVMDRNDTIDIDNYEDWIKAEEVFL